MAGNLEYSKTYAFERTISLLQHNSTRKKEHNLKWSIMILFIKIKNQIYRTYFNIS